MMTKDSFFNGFKGEILKVFIWNPLAQASSDKAQ